MTAGDSIPSLGRFHEDLGMWVRVNGGAHASPRAALFLDRDGVVVEDTGYLFRAEEVALIPGAAEVIALANRLGIPVIEVTNQAGIARGYYGWDEFVEVEDAMAAALKSGGAAIDAAFACPFHREGIAPWVHPAHPARKPRPGMLLAAQRWLNLDLGSSWMVGDKQSDLESARNAGLRGGLHVLTGHGAEYREAVLGWRPEDFEVRTGDSIRDAASVLESLAAR